MALISIKRNVDLQPGLNAPAVFNCSQSDKGTTIMLGLMNGGNDYTVPSGVTITIRGSRSNGAVFTPASATFSGSTVSFTLTEEMTDTAGPTLCEAVLEQGNNVLGTANFIINVEASPMGADVPPVFTDAAWTWMLGKLTTETVPALGDDVISSIQGKVDKSQGSTNAKKFLRVNTSGNVSLASTDKTLSVADQIADAKETGDQIRALDAEIDGVATTLGGSISTLNGITTDLQSSKLNKNQGTSNVGKVLMVNQDGTVSPAAVDLSGKANESTIAPEFSDQNNYTAGSYVYKNGVLYRFTAAHSGAWTGIDAETVTVSKDLTDLRSAIRQSYNVYGTLRQGWYGADGQHHTSGVRITTDPIPVIRGQRIYVDSAGLKYGVQFWNGTPSSATSIRSESVARVPGTDVITALGDWYIVIAFGKTDDTSLSPSEFTGEIRVYSPQIDQLNTGLDDMREFLVNVIPDEINYGKYISTDVGSVYSLGSSGAFNVVLFSVKPNTHYVAQTKGRRTTTKYLGFLDSENKVVSYIEKTVSTNGETVLYDDFVSPSNAAKVFINETTGSNERGENVQYVWLKEQMFSTDTIEGANIVSEEKMLCVEAAKKTFTTTTTDNIADNPLPTFIHVTDMHGDADRFANAVKIAEEVGADAIINTGDQVAYNPTNSVAYIEYALTGVEIPFLPLIGNHESYTATEQEMYTRHIQPFVTSSGLTVDSSVAYPTYYYKDFPDHKIRVIGVNQWQYRGVENMTTQRNYYQAQIDFICESLISAPDGYGIIVLLHTPEIGTVKTAAYPKFYQDEILYNDVAGRTSPIYEIVDAYISGTALNKTFNNADGNTPATYTVNVDFSTKHDSEFICYLSGHMHRDAIYYITGVTNKQLMLNEVCTNSWSHRNANGTPGSGYPYYTEMTDLPRVIGTPTENAVNLYTIDRERKTVRIVRIGSDMPYDLERRDCMTIPYAD